jgi:undecaprenyl-diphosphatase
MTFWQSIILGVVQGATEFLPISSSGHLVLVPWLLNWNLDPAAAFIFDVLVQWGTLLAVITYFFQDLIDIIRAVLRGLIKGEPFNTPLAKRGWLLVLASVPAALLGVLAKSSVEAAFANPRIVSLFLLATAAILFASERIGKQRRDLDQITSLDALIIGLAQSLALFPGISRSGSTIAGGLTRDLTRADAARFSFLMSVPVMIGAGLITLLDLANMPGASDQLTSLALGFISAAVVGYLSIRWLLNYLSRRPLTIFIIYCSLIGAGGLILSVFRG